jgi:hypothetical protein
MFNQAILAGLPIDSAQVAQNLQRIDPTKPISFDLVHVLAPLEPMRTMRHGDLIHVSVAERQPVTINGVVYHYNNPAASFSRVDDSGNVVPAPTFPTV